MYCCVDPGGPDTFWHRSLSRAIDSAEKCLEAYRDQCQDEGWSDAAENIVVYACPKKMSDPAENGKVVACSVRTNVRLRPPPEELEDGVDDKGYLWEGDIDMICDYKIEKVELQ